MNYDKDMLKRFISYYGPHKRLFYLDLLAAFLMAAIELCYPVFTTRVIDEYIPNGMLSAILVTVAIMLGLYVIMAGLNYFVNYWGHVVGVRMEADMRDDMFKHLQKQPFSFFDAHRTGKLMSRIINDLNEVSELAHHGPEDIFISFVMFAGAFVILVRQEWHLAVGIFAFAIPAMIWFSVTQRKKMSLAFKGVREETADINAQIENSLAGIRVAKSYTNEAHEIEKFIQGNRRFRGSKNHAYKEMSFFATGMGFLISLLNVIVLGAGGYLTYRGTITVGELTGFLLYINLVMQPIRRLTNFTQQFEQGMNGFARFEEIMRVEPDIVDGKRVLEKARGEIEMKHVSFDYNDKEKVIRDLSLVIPKGRTVALVGPSGGGKTTLCHLIPRFYDVDEGEVLVDGINVKDYTLNSLRTAIGLVQQEVFLFTGTIKDNILYGRPSATDADMKAAAENAHIAEFIDGLADGYDTWIGEKGVRLSGGQKQRLSIARMFLKNPPILILDEATSSLDNESEKIIQKSLVQLSKGRTTLVIAHRLSTIRNADMIIVLSDQGVEAQGTHEELYAKADGLYKRLYDAQFSLESNRGIQGELNE